MGWAVFGAVSERGHKDADPVRFVWAIHQRLQGEVRGKHGGPLRTILVRGLVILLALGLAGDILGHALVTMPTGLKVFIGSALVVRVLVAARRRFFRQT